MVGPLIWESENLSAFREMESCSLFGGPPISPAPPVGVEQRSGMSLKEEGIFVSDYSPAQAAGPWVLCRQLPQELLWAWWESDQWKGCGIEGGGCEPQQRPLGGSSSIPPLWGSPSQIPFISCYFIWYSAFFNRCIITRQLSLCTSGNESLYFRNLFFTEKYPIQSWRPASS